MAEAAVLKRTDFGIGWELISQATSLALDVALFPGFLSFFGGGGSNYVAQAGLELLDHRLQTAPQHMPLGVSLQSARAVDFLLSQRGPS